MTDFKQLKKLARAEYNKRYHAANKLKANAVSLAYYRAHREELLPKMAAYGDKTKEKRAERNKKWNLENRARRLSHNAKRRAARIGATPKWLTNVQLAEIAEIYALAKELQWLSEEPLEVDHIIPLRGADVCGLHVPWNLQILPRSLNAKKSNHYDTP